MKQDDLPPHAGSSPDRESKPRAADVPDGAPRPSTSTTRVNYDHRVFRGRSNSSNGEVGGGTRFEYRQVGDRIWAQYRGGQVVSGHLQGKVAPDGSLDFVYHHENVEGELMAGTCHSTPSQDANGTLVLRESWQWLTGDRTSGTSEVEEVDDSS